ncbi:MAG: PaaI family thioesterase [Actinomycetota bacterium]
MEQVAGRRLKDYNAKRGPLLDKVGLEWLEAGADRVVGRMPVESNSQAWGILHGGASAILVESVASFGAWLADTGRIALGVELKVNHLRPAQRGFITGTGTPLMSGKSLSVWEVRVVDDSGTMIAFGTCTVALRDREPDLA